MKILLCAKSYYFTKNSGDTDLIYNIYSYLKSHNIEVAIGGANEEIDYGNYDIVHIFDIKNIFDAYKHFKMASNKRCNIIVTPMYFDMSNYFNHSNNKDRINSWKKCKIYRDLIINKSRKIICSSEYEKKLIERDFTPKGDIDVIYNGVDISDEEVPLYNFKERYNLDNYILCVGRICESKNQLTLSSICSELKIPLVLVGPPVENGYLRSCLKYKYTHYLGYMDDYDLYNAYSFCRAHVLPSFLEVTGLSSLKAAAYGCNVVVTEEGASKEYFEDMAIYCNPYDYDSIKKAVSESFSSRRNYKLRDMVIKEYSLKDSMEKLMDVYQSIILTE